VPTALILLSAPRSVAAIPDYQSLRLDAHTSLYVSPGQSTRRTREVGIRIALGASGNDIAGLFAWEAAAMIALGTLIGVPGALAAVRLLKSQLFGVAPHDPSTLAGCVLCVVVTVILASVAPIRRALRIAPQQALRID
jgi:putative ABC transport system permease protein